MADLGPENLTFAAVPRNRQRPALHRLVNLVAPTRVARTVSRQPLGYDCRADVGAVIQVTHAYFSVVGSLPG